jgi:transcriptional regulator
MYASPKHRLSEDDARAALAAYDRAAILITPDLQATHLPLLMEGDRLIGHVARANAHWRAAPCAALVVCPGAETYVSPNWYETKQQTHRAVPTWNYVTLHVRGELTTFDDAGRLEHVVACLSARHEAGQPQPWSLADAPRDYIDAMLRAIVGVEIRIESLHAKAKLSQDKNEADRTGVIGALSDSDDPRDQAIAALMRATNA